MRKKLAILLALLSLSTFLAACGDDEEALSKEEFIEEGDAICGELSSATGDVEDPESEDDLARYLEELLGHAETAREDFAELSPPEDGEEVHQELLDSLDATMSTVEGAIDAAEDGDTVTVEDLLTQANEEGNAADEAAQEYGFEECGSEEGSDEEDDTSRSAGGAAG